ncbi:hypothetical protein BJV82DRAFT_590062 [Fennellomyces sp. T-0311]|nr:hypothetical protein BJV82DRAFT_590062 [Fennellomyces sp. T-0311]
MQLTLPVLVLALLSATAVIAGNSSGNRGATVVDASGLLKDATVVQGHLADVPILSTENDNEHTGSSGVNVDKGPGSHLHNSQ